jgi:hypothetical protein
VASYLDASHRVFPPLKLKPCHPPTSPRQDHPSVLRNGHMQREKEALGDMTFSPNLTARCVVGKGQRSIHRSDAPNMMGRCACSMPPASLTVALVPCASTVKDMAPPPKNLVVSALSCIPCRRWDQKSRRLRAFLPLPLIPSFGVIGHALSLATRGYDGNGATWSWWKLRPFHCLAHRLRLSRVPSERIGV